MILMVLYLVTGDSGSGLQILSVNWVTDPDGTADNGDETYTVGAEDLILLVNLI